MHPRLKQNHESKDQPEDIPGYLSAYLVSVLDGVLFCSQFQLHAPHRTITRSAPGLLQSGVELKPVGIKASDFSDCLPRK